MTHLKYTFSIGLALAILVFCACDRRKIVYSGLNDLVIGVQQILLYDDHTFYLEISLGGIEGTYRIDKDKVTLYYDEEPGDRWPDVMYIRDTYFISADSLDYRKRLHIYRIK